MVAKKQAMPAEVPGWSELWQKEDWWAIWLGLGLVIAGIIAYLAGGTIKPIAVKPATWDSFAALRGHFAAQYYWYLLQFLLWALVLGISAWSMGWKLDEFLLSFLFVYVASLIIFTIGQWKEAGAYNLEPPLVALVLGLIVSNLLRLPAWMDVGFRVEYYIKTGIVLLGATLPFTLIIWAGPLAMCRRPSSPSSPSRSSSTQVARLESIVGFVPALVLVERFVVYRERSPWQAR